MNAKDTKIMLGIVLTAIVASSVPLYAMFIAPKATLHLAAEDDCPYTYHRASIYSVVRAPVGVYCYYR